MNIDTIIDTEEPETRSLDYKHPEATPEDLVKELVSVANSGGGSVIVGVEESDGCIVDIHDVANASEREESIQQHIREKVSPKLSVSPSIEEYTGEDKEHQEKQLLVLNTEPGGSLYSYRESGSEVVFPYRLGSTTDYLTGVQIDRYYRADIRPGRPKSKRQVNDSESSADAETLDDQSEIGKSPWEDFATTLATIAQGETENDSSENKVPNKTLPDIDLEVSEKPYYFTPAGGLETITFHQSPYLPQPYALEGTELTVEKTELVQIFAALKKYLNTEIESGHFTITQRNAAWFGRGAADFIAATDVDKRYSAVPDSFDIDKHHSEGTIFIADSHFGTVVVRSRRGINVNREHLDQFSVSFCTDGVPVDTRSLDRFLNAIDAGTHHAYPFELDSEQVRFGHQNIKMEPIKLLPSKHTANFAGRAICKNPFYEEPSLLLDSIDSDKTDFETLTKYKFIPCRIKDHHPMDTPQEYKLLRAKITPFTPVQGRTPHANAMVWINW